jgi:hypothetical protein
MINLMSHAEREFRRIRGMIAWAPVANVCRVDSNQFWRAYTFADGTRLELWTSGSAQWADDNRRQGGYAENHHRCNHWGV